MSTTTQPSPKPLSLEDLYKAIVPVWDTIRQYPQITESYKGIGSVLDTLNALFYRKPPFADYFAHDLINSVPFRYSVCEYILKQRGDYHLGNDRLPATADYPEGSSEKRERDKLFEVQKGELFRVAYALQVMRSNDVYEFARTCPDFYFVNELSFYYGGAGRTCVDTHMTLMSTSLDEVRRIAQAHVRANTPLIDYREIFTELESEYLRDNLISKAQPIESVFPNPHVWIGAQAFTTLLQNAHVTMEVFQEAFSDLSCQNNWLRPFVRISNFRSEDRDAYNQLHFDLETGCSWLFYSS